MRATCATSSLILRASRAAFGSPSQGATPICGRSLWRLVRCRYRRARRCDSPTIGLRRSVSRWRVRGMERVALLGPFPRALGSRSRSPAALVFSSMPPVRDSSKLNGTLALRPFGPAEKWAASIHSRTECGADMTQADIAAFLESAAAVDAVSSVEPTHGTTRFLCGSRALKLKRVISYASSDMPEPSRAAPCYSVNLAKRRCGDQICHDTLPVTCFAEPQPYRPWGTVLDRQIKAAAVEISSALAHAAGSEAEVVDQARKALGLGKFRNR